MTTPPSLLALVEAFERMPGIGRRGAERLAHHLLRVEEAEALRLAEAIREVRARVRPCRLCRAPSEPAVCPICADDSRDRSVLMVVETARDLMAWEGAGGYRGLYYVLGSSLSPLEGVAEEDLHLEALRERVTAHAVQEVCVATNPDLEGDGTARVVERALLATQARVSRLARGLPVGGRIEHQSAAALAEAFERRRPANG